MRGMGGSLACGLLMRSYFALPYTRHSGRFSGVLFKEEIPRILAKVRSTQTQTEVLACIITSKS
jgi:hypothetical protein